MTDRAPDFEAYRRVLKKVDATVAQLAQAQHEHLVCKEGCDGCCGFRLSFYPIEVAHMADVVSSMTTERRTGIVNRMRTLSQDSSQQPCPLLVDGACLAYEARPLLCRSHGLLVRVLSEAGQPSIERSCSLNYTGLSEAELAELAPIDQNLLSSLLYQVNGLFAEKIRLDPKLRLDLTHLLDFLPANGER